MEAKDDKDVIATLRDHGLQVTYQRLAIYQALYYTKEHPGAEAIYQQVKKRFPMISLGTVYKTLERFHEVGLIQKVGPLTEVARYDAVTEYHHHFVCLKCQGIHDISGTIPVMDMSSHVEPGFQVVQSQVVLQGYCPTCVE